MCMNSISFQYAHIYVGFVIYIVVSLTTMDPMSLGTILRICSRYIGYAFGASLIYKEGGVTMCLLYSSSNDCELLSSTSPNAISVTSIYLMHTFLAFNLV